MNKIFKITYNGNTRILTRFSMTIILAIMLILGSCQKYLDIKKTGTDKFIETADDCQRLLDKYDVMNGSYPSDGQASSDDYYLGSNAFPSFLSQENKDIYTWKSTAIRAAADPQWLKPYQTIYQANLVLEALDFDKVKKSTNTANLNNLRGSALFFRAYALWNIAQLYAKPYSTVNQDMGIPARTSPDLSDVFGRGTVQETYNRITDDLKEAVGLLDPTSVIATRPNKVSAYAMLARVYLSMEDYAQALSNSKAALDIKGELLDYNTLNMSSPTPFPRLNIEVLFQSVITSQDASGFPLVQPGSAGSPRAKINQTLYDSYSDYDLRKSLYFEVNNDGTARFTGSYDPTSNIALFNGLTIDEMYLIRAECYARTGNISAAMNDLNTLLAKRWKNTVTYSVITATTADEAISKILTERRKELVMRGQRWTDLRRLNKDVRFKVDLIRTVGDPPNQVSYTLPANDLRYTLLIPKEVIDKASMQQNMR